jgi:hypothetical protein
MASADRFGDLETPFTKLALLKLGTELLKDDEE